jgi:hypothetical protein
MLKSIRRFKYSNKPRILFVLEETSTTLIGLELNSETTLESLTSYLKILENLKEVKPNVPEEVRKSLLNEDSNKLLKAIPDFVKLKKFLKAKMEK